MKGFLAEVAADLYGRYGEALSQREVLFFLRHDEFNS